jgi:NADH-quinone oxidoreductase subunit G
MGAELLARLDGGETREFPLFSSCCPAWVQFVEKEYPELLVHLSSCKSPMQMFASVIRERENGRHFHAAVMPCTAKKFEAARAEFASGGQRAVDCVISTEELIQMIREAGIVFDELVPEAPDAPFRDVSGGGVLFGVSGGVTEAVLRHITADKSPASFMQIAYAGARGGGGIKEVSLPAAGRRLCAAVVSGLQNAREIIRRVKAGERFDFVEVMACRGGCINGGGQPFAAEADKVARARNLYTRDKLASFSCAEHNPSVRALYESGPLKERAHDLLPRALRKGLGGIYERSHHRRACADGAALYGHLPRVRLQDEDLHAAEG